MRLTVFSVVVTVYVAFGCVSLVTYTTERNRKQGNQRRYGIVL